MMGKTPLSSLTLLIAAAKSVLLNETFANGYLVPGLSVTTGVAVSSF